MTQYTVRIAANEDIGPPTITIEVPSVDAAIGLLSARTALPTGLIDCPEAARVLGIGLAALRKRIERGDVNPRNGLVRTGRRVQFHLETLLTSFGGARR